MFDLLGFLTITLIAILTILIASKWPDIYKIAIVALVIRIIFLILGNYFISLPDSTADANSFETRAWTMAQGGFFNLLDYYVGPDPKFISWLIAIPYSLFGRSILMAKSISLLFGMGSVFLGWKLAHKLWDSHAAKKIAWTIALFPPLILYSVLTMREAYISFFILLGIYGVVSWSKTESYKGIFLALIGFVGASFFHGASFIGAMTFLTIVALSSLIKFCRSIFYLQISIKIFIILIIFLIFLKLYISNDIYIPYLGDFQNSSDLEILLRKTQVSVMGTASYPEWTVAKSPIELVYKIPIRSLYFLFSLFPWDVSETKHIIGMLDAFLYMYLAYLIWQNRNVILQDRALLIILLILMSYIIVFSVGVGNFGTGIRHRSKLVIMLILLAGPLLKTFVIKKK